MSTDPAPIAPTPPPTPPAAAPAAASPVTRPRRRWRRRLVVAGAAMLVIAVAFRLLLLVLLPTVISRVAARMGVGCRYERMELSVLGGNVEMWGIAITSADGATELVRTGYAHANLSTLDLLGLRLVASRLEVDGVRLDLVRKADGSIPLLDELAKAAAARAKTRPAGVPPDFTSPLQIDALRASGVEARVRDESVTPVFERTVRVDARAVDLGHPKSRATVELLVGSDDLLDSLRLTGQTDLQGPTIKASLEFALRGLRPTAAEAYLAPLGLTPAQDRVDVTGAVDLALDAAAAGPGAVQATAAVRGLRVLAGTQPIASLAAADVVVASVSPSALHVSKVAVEGGSVRVGRTGSGEFRVSPITVGQTPAARGSAEPARAPSPAAATPFRWRFDDVSVKGVEAVFDDDSLESPSSLTLSVGALAITGLDSAAPAGSRAAFTADLAMPGLASAIRATGTAAIAAGAPAADVEIAIDGLTGKAVAPYLRPLGVEPILGSASLRATVAARVAEGADGQRVHASVKNLALTNADGALIELAEASIDGLSLAAGAGLDVDAVRATGPVLALRVRDARSLEACGFRYTAPVSGAPAGPATDGEGERPPRAGFDAMSLPRVRIGSLTWGGTAIRLEDLTSDTGRIEIADAGVEITGLVFDPRAEAGAPQAGSLRAWVHSPGVVDRLEVAGTLRPAPSSLGADVTVTGDGVQLARLAPCLRPFGIEPTLRDGAVRLQASASVTQSPGSVAIAASIKEASIAQAGEPLASIALLDLERLVIGGPSVEVGRITVESPALAVMRHEDGSFEAMGIRLAAPAPVAEAPARAAPFDPFAVLEMLPAASLRGASVREARIVWSDHAAAAPVEVRLTADASLGALAIGTAKAEAATFELKVDAPGVVDRLEAVGALRLTPRSIDLDAGVRADGLSSGTVAAYLPPSIDPDLHSAALSTELGMSLSRADAGGLAASLTVAGLDFREADASAPLAGLESLDIRVRRIDPAAGVIDVERVAASGLAGDAARRADGRLSIFGVTLGRAGDEPVVSSADPAAADVQQLVGAGRGSVPSITLDELDLHVSRATFADETGALAAPVTLADVRVRSLAPVHVRADKPDASPPLRLAISGGVEPVLRRFDLGLTLEPFADRPAAQVTLAADGIDGRALLAFAPGLEGLIDASPLVDGRLRTSIELDAGVRRRGPLQVDLSHGIDLTLTVDRTELRLGESGTLLAGVERINGEQIRLDPTTGSVIARSLEVTGLSGSGWRDDAGIHVLGVVVRLRTEPQGNATPADPAPQAVAAAPEPTRAGAPSSAEYRIERLTISGADFRFEDRLLTPPVTIPITALEADVRGLSSLALAQDRPIKFNVSASSGKISLPKPVRGGVLTGALGDLGRMMAGDTQSTASEMEDRDFFSQCLATGTMSFYPKPRGRVLAAVSGVELTALRGLAKDAGASVGGGIFDGRVELLGREDGGLDVRSRLVLTDLQYAEPPDGPVARYLSLPVPLDAAIAAVQSADGSITLPVNLTVDGSGLSTGKVLGAASGAIGSVLVTAVASTPAKVVTGFAGLFGDVGGQTGWIEEEPIALEFQPGLTILPPAAQERLADVLRRARSDKKVQVVIDHEFGPADLELAARRANPAPEQARALAEDLRHRRLELIARRTTLLAPARAAATDPSRAPAAEQLRELQTELARVEDAFDDLYDLLRPGADRQASRRSRGAAVDLADARLDHLRAMVRETAGAGGERVALGNPRAILGTDGPSRLLIRVRRAGR